jgi:hypothetical protein
MHGGGLADLGGLADSDGKDSIGLCFFLVE